MKLIINDTISIFEIQDQFSKKYPFLKIEFFSQPHDIHVGSRKENLIPANLQLKYLDYTFRYFVNLEMYGSKQL